MEADPHAAHPQAPGVLDPECARILTTLQGLLQNRASPWVGLVELRQALGMPMRVLEPHLGHLCRKGLVVVRPHNKTAATSRYATLRALGRSITLAHGPPGGPTARAGGAEPAGSGGGGS